MSQDPLQQLDASVPLYLKGLEHCTMYITIGRPLGACPFLLGWIVCLIHIFTILSRSFYNSLSWDVLSWDILSMTVWRGTVSLVYGNFVRNILYGDILTSNGHINPNVLN